jgi:cytochrome c oxidase subunit 3
MNTSTLHLDPPPDSAVRERALSVGLWVFLGVVTSLFSLFVTAYVMRLSSPDATAIAMPWQLWLSTGLLALGSVAMHRGQMTVGGACAVAFLVVQWWAWQALQAANVVLAGNPAASFFYLLTALHGLHVAGGLVAWVNVQAEPTPGRVALCARYWHFLLLLWVVLFTLFSTVTPDVARAICGVAP